MRRSSSGGAAAAGGAEYQNRVAAWVTVRILAEQDSTPPWELPGGTTLEWIRCETEQPIDDMLVGTSVDGFVFAQIKRTLHLEKSSDSDLAKTLDQFVRQFTACRDGAIGAEPQGRRLDPNLDRFVIITSSSSSRSILYHIPAVLRRLRGLLENQSSSNAALNQDELDALSVVKDHIKRSWMEATEEEPSDDDLRDLLSLVHVQVLEMDAEGSGEREALDLLRRAVLRDPEQAEPVYTHLFNLTSELAAQRSGANRMSLQGSLLDSGFYIKHIRSYEKDIARLEEYSNSIQDILNCYSHIRIGSEMLKIKRDCVAVLREAALNDSTLVVGEPGAGKSGALHDLAKMIDAEDYDYILFSVDRLTSQSLSGLCNEIGLEHKLLNILNNWPGFGPAFVIIDSLDAARGEPAERMVLDLIYAIIRGNGRWRVVASIRKFDLRYGYELKSLFPGEPPSDLFRDSEFSSIIHINIPRLSEKELKEIASQSPGLDALVRSAPAELKVLLHTLFNLQLLGELLGEGVSVEELTPIKTEHELLDGYWRHRILVGNRGDARESVLRVVCKKMLEERALHLDRSAIARAETNDILGELLSMQILAEWQPSPETPPERYILTFSHHVLFDYAVERLLLRGDPRKVVQSLSSDPDLVVAIHPSLRLHFQYLWMIDGERKIFWDTVFRIIQEDMIPEIGKLIGPTTAAELVRELSDLESLISALENSERRLAAEEALRHLFGALLARDPDSIPLIGPEAGPWSEFLERVSRSLNPHIADTIRLLLSTMCDHPENMTPSQRSNAGKAARCLLDYFWSQSPINTWQVRLALKCVCRTFESDPAKSAAILGRCFEKSHLSQYDYVDLPQLASEVKRLIPIDHGFVEELYKVAFTHDVASEEQTQLYPSGILPIASTRPQDYQMALYELARAFPDFMENAPENATHVLIVAMEAYVAKRHHLNSRELQEVVFELNGLQAKLIADYSHIWDKSDVYRHDDPMKMLDAFQKYLESLEGSEDGIERFQKTLQIIVSENRLAIIWRRIISVGSRFPNTIGREILPLAWTLPVLVNHDTTNVIGEFVRAIFPILSSEERKRIEQAILSIPAFVPTEKRDYAEHYRNRLLGCLTIENIVGDDVRLLLEELSREDAIPSNEEPKSSAVWVGEYGEEEYLKDEGVPVEAEPNRRIREFEKPVQEFADSHLNSTPTIEEANEALPSLSTLREALLHADANDVHPRQRDHAWGSLAKACACIAKMDGLSSDVEPGSFIIDVLLEASDNPEPVPDPKYDAQFDEHPSWGSPAARLDAAEGLILLARHPGCVSHEVLKLIARLVADPVPAVRFQIASHLNCLYRTAPEMMWSIIERTCNEEPSRGVLLGLITYTLRQIAGAEPDRVADLTKLIYDRIIEGPGASEVREKCIGLFADLYIWRNQDLSYGVIFEAITNPRSFPKEAHCVLYSFRDALTHGPVSPPDPKADAIRQRAISILERILHSALEGWNALKQSYDGSPINQWPQEDQDQAKSLLRLIDGVANEIYFASGAFEDKRQRDHMVASTLEPESGRFYHEVSKILDDLTRTDLPSVTHHLIETLEFFIPVDPREIFIHIGQVVSAGREVGYEHESLAIDLIVKIVERYLADYRALLREDIECRQTLIDILDTFVQVGWPSARRLAYRLEEIFR